MSYTALTFDAAGIDADRWSDALIDAGALSVDVSDPAAGTPHEQAVYAEPNVDAATWPQLFLKYVIAHPAVTVAIPGTTKLAHLEDNQLAGRGRLPDAALRKKIEDYWASA